MSAPLSVSGAWQTARHLCPRGCFAYHATWRLFRQMGLKGSPHWHFDFYQTALASRPAGQPTRALVCGSSDETMPALLADLMPELSIVVADACDTPLHLVSAWAAQSTADVITRRSHAPALKSIDGPFDLIVTDGLLSLLPEAADRDLLIARLASMLADDGLLLYTTRIAGPGGRLEYDLPGRLLQSLAALTWRGHPVERLTIALHRWLRPSRTAAYTGAQQVADAFHAAFGHVDMWVTAVPPSLALAVHPVRWIGRGSLRVGVAATHPNRGTPYDSEHHHQAVPARDRAG
ncbi:class I SAM-dependent methyltransferase [Nonomuraea sp. NPDC046802]|uniref:class I SAM-dependent methyltransferase n=1 Tax=Nonomuraea sp. NPDC046802 TaxID=3154919 RepID=UPI0033EF31C1